MSAHADTHADDSTPPEPKRFKPHQFAIALGIGVGVFTLISGILPQITDWHNENDVHRVVFVDIPGPLQVVFYTVIPVMIVWGGFMFADRMKNWERGAPRSGARPRRTRSAGSPDFRAGVVHAHAAARPGRRAHALDDLLRVPGPARPSRRCSRSTTRCRATSSSCRRRTSPTRSSATLAGARVPRSASSGRSSVATCSGRTASASRSKPEHAVDPRHVPRRSACRGFLAEVFRIAVSGQPSYEKWSFVGYPLSQARRRLVALRRCRPGTSRCGSSTSSRSSCSSRAAHHDAAPHVHVAAQHVPARPGSPEGRDAGRCRTSPRPCWRRFGASVVEDFTWKQLLDTDACTMCGRCTSVCPAHATGKPLDPREIVLKAGEVMAATRQPGRQPAARHGARDHDLRQLAVRADHRRGDLGLHQLQGVRRDLPGEHRDPRQDPRHAALPVADGVELPGRARQRLPGDGEPGQPVGHEPGRARRLGRRARRRHRGRSGRAARSPSTCTGWVAPARSTTRTRRSPRPWRKLLRRAGIDVAILGPSEMCTGDSARRSRQRVPVPDARPCPTSRCSTAWA